MCVLEAIKLFPFLNQHEISFQGSIDRGTEELESMKLIDFSEDRAKANEKKRIAMQLVEDVKDYFKDVDSIKGTAELN